MSPSLAVPDEARQQVASFRDPAGSLIRQGTRILRYVTPAAAATVRKFLDTQTAQRFLTSGNLVGTVFHSSDAATGAEILEHERIDFPSFPYEWPPEMLSRAAELTLDLSESLLSEGFWLKDANPYNILYRGPEPVFVDLPSFEERDPLEQTWLPYSQFTRTFLFILMAHRHFGRPPAELLLTRRDGPEPSDMYRWATFWQRLSPGFLGTVSLPVWFDRNRKQSDEQLYRKRLGRSAEQSQFVLGSVYRSLRRSLRRLSTKTVESRWTGYLDHKSLYSPETLGEKETFVREALEQHRPAATLDVGCNEGHFSEMAARAGSRVVAIDYDPAVAGAVWRRAEAQKLDILPLVVDLTRPTPGIGWRNQECPSFLDRAKGHFDMVMMLAVIHHMVVTERIPLRATLEMAADLTSNLAIIEFVGPQDPMFRRLVRGRDLLHKDLTVDQFEREAGCLFRTLKKHRLEGLDRWLFLLQKK